MKFTDFEFDNLLLSEMGFVICNFNGKTSTDATVGSQLEFNTVSQRHGTKEDLITASYKQHLECTFQICKKSCNSDIEEISLDEIRKMYSWLNREEFHKFKPLADEYIGLYFEGSFNVSCIEINGKTYGMELTFVSNRPFALEESKMICFKATSGNMYAINDTSDKEGHIYPELVEIKVLQDGDLIIENQIEGRRTIITNCVAGEVITMKYPVITTNQNIHAIQNDFNWNFLRIANTFRNKKNILTFSLSCEVKIIYSPIAKIVI